MYKEVYVVLGKLPFGGRSTKSISLKSLYETDSLDWQVHNDI